MQDAARLALRLDRSELSGRAIFVSPCKKGVDAGSHDQPKLPPQVILYSNGHMMSCDPAAKG